MKKHLPGSGISSVSFAIGRFRRYLGRAAACGAAGRGQRRLNRGRLGQAGGLALRDRQPPSAGSSGGLGLAVSHAPRSRPRRVRRCRCSTAAYERYEPGVSLPPQDMAPASARPLPPPPRPGPPPPPLRPRPPPLRPLPPPPRPRPQPPPPRPRPPPPPPRPAFLVRYRETARDGLAANCVQMYVAAPPLERAGMSGCPAQPACATLPTRIRGTR